MSDAKSIASDPLGISADQKTRELRVIVAVANDATGYWWGKTRKIPALAFEYPQHREYWTAFTAAKSWADEDRPSGYILPLLNHPLLSQSLSTVTLDVKWLLLRWAETLDPSQWRELAEIYPPDVSIDDDPASEFGAHMFNLSSPPPKAEVRFSIAGKPVCTPGNLTALIAQAKTGKTALIGAFIAAFIAAYNQMTQDCDLLGLSSCPPAGRRLIHFDTEQSPEDHDEVIRRAIRRARADACPDTISVRLTTIPIADRLMVIRRFVEFHARHGGVHAVIIDGVADLVHDVNEIKECAAMVAELHALAINSNCPIICVIHDNEGKVTNGDGRGHLGKQLMRKAESNLRLKKKDEKTVIFSEKMRRAPIFEKDGPCFEWSDVSAMHVSTSNVAAEQSQQTATKLREMAVTAFAGAQEITAMSFRLSVAASSKKTERTAERYISEMLRAGIVRQSGGGKYMIQ
jgi:hypothetical protein